MLQCIDDTINSEGFITFHFNDGSKVVALQDTLRPKSPFILKGTENVSKEQIDAIQIWSACPVLKE